MEEIFKDEVLEETIPEDTSIEENTEENTEDEGKVINFQNAVEGMKLKDVVEQQETQLDKILAGVKKLPRFVAEVASKNTIRGLPNNKVGDIFWSQMDKCAWIIESKDNKKITLRKLDETASISTGMSIYDMTKAISSREELFNWEDKEAVDKLIVRYLEWKKDIPDKYFLLFGIDIGYVTLFKETDGGLFNGIKEAVQSIGELISLDFEDEKKQIEVWIRTAKDPAALLYLTAFDTGLWEV
jgi:hypothetical protein